MSHASSDCWICVSSQMGERMLHISGTFKETRYSCNRGGLIIAGLLFGEEGGTLLWPSPTFNHNHNHRLDLVNTMTIGILPTIWKDIQDLLFIDWK